MKEVAIIILLIALASISAWFLYDHNSLARQLSEAQQASSQSTSISSLALATCLGQAEVEYDQTWNGLCAQMGQGEYCNTFVGSPKDVEFTQLRDQEKALCGTLYK